MDKKPAARILIVDDEPDFLATISYWLTSRGYDVVVANGGTEALARLSGSAFDVIFLDIVMPQLGGLETLKRLRAMGVKSPVVLLTTTGQDPVSLIDFQAFDIKGLFQKQGSLAAFAQVLEAALKARPASNP